MGWAGNVWSPPKMVSLCPPLSSPPPPSSRLSPVFDSLPMPWQAASKAAGLLSQLKAAFSQGDDKLDTCLQYLTQLKITMLDFASLPPAAPSAAQDEELLLAREILEYGALLAIKAIDIPSFERQVAQLKTYYTDCASRLPESPRQYPILGLNLLRLLAQNRIAEFHTELEVLPAQLIMSNVYIKFPAQLEQHIMEGSYNKVLSAKQASPGRMRSSIILFPADCFPPVSKQSLSCVCLRRMEHMRRRGCTLWTCLSIRCQLIVD